MLSRVPANLSVLMRMRYSSHNFINSHVHENFNSFSTCSKILTLKISSVKCFSWCWYDCIEDLRVDLTLILLLE